MSGRPNLRTVKAPETPADLAPIDAEQTVLGGLMLEPEKLEEVGAVLGPGDFFRPHHRTLYALLVAMGRDREPIELVSVIQRIRATRQPDEYGGLGYVSALPDQVVSTENLLHYARTVRLYALRRSTRDLARRLSTMLVAGAEDQERDLAEVLTRASQELQAVSVQVGQVRSFDGPDPLVRAKLALNAQRLPKATLSNLTLIFGEDPRWSSLRLNRLGDTIEWNQGTWEQGAAMRAEAARWLAQHYRLDVSSGSLIEEALLAVAQARAFYPVEEYLRGLTWDGTPRIERLLGEVLGVESAPLLQLYVRRFLLSAVARALEPGCKVDTGLILVGSQGAKKSGFFKTLFGPEWFGDSPIPIGDKDAAILLQRVWGYEAAEMEDLSRKTAEAVKQFMSTAADIYRSPYERSATAKKRRSVLCGTANRAEILVDDTGARRFWLLTIPHGWIVRLDLVTSWRDQLWAEARAAYERGERWWFEIDEEAELGRAADVRQYQERDPWEGDVEEALRTVYTPFKTEEVLKWLKLRAEERNQNTSRRVAKILSGLGYLSKTMRPGKGDLGVVRRWTHPRWAVEPLPPDVPL